MRKSKKKYTFATPMAKKQNIGFQFKQFFVRHDASSMRVGTDAVLLGAWCPIPAAVSMVSPYTQKESSSCLPSIRVLDIGTGCGVIALMMAQRIAQAPAQSAGGMDWHIDAIDIDEPSVAQAADNFAQSPWSHHLHAEQSAVQDWKLNTYKKSVPSAEAASTYNNSTSAYHDSALAYDLIVSNPPFFSQGLLSPDPRRAKARFSQITLSYADLTRSVARLLRENGILGVILPTEEEKLFTDAAQMHHLYPSSRCAVRSVEEGTVTRIMLAFQKQSQHTEDAIRSFENEEIILSTPTSPRSPAYTHLTKEFYL